MEDRLLHVLHDVYETVYFDNRITFFQICNINTRHNLHKTMFIHSNFKFFLREKRDCDHIRTLFIGGKNTAYIALIVFGAEQYTYLSS